jgi:hypothetical protein
VAGRDRERIARSEFKVETLLPPKYRIPMPLTVDQVVEEARQWPTDRLVELLDRLTLALPAPARLDAEWGEEIRRRVTEIQQGSVTGIPGEVVSGRVRALIRR